MSSKAVPNWARDEEPTLRRPVPQAATARSELQTRVLTQVNAIFRSEKHAYPPTPPPDLQSLAATAPLTIPTHSLACSRVAADSTCCCTRQLLGSLQGRARL